MLKKSETIISVEKDEFSNSISHVKSAYTRGMEFEEFTFMINMDGLPEIITKEQAIKEGASISI